jgi:hypothetical protein
VWFEAKVLIEKDASSLKLFSVLSKEILPPDPGFLMKPYPKPDPRFFVAKSSKRNSDCFCFKVL